MISNVEEEDEGEYICYAENVAGRSEELAIVLDVQGELVLIGVVRKCICSTYLEVTLRGSVNGLLPIRHQAIIWPNVDLL